MQSVTAGPWLSDTLDYYNRLKVQDERMRDPDSRQSRTSGGSYQTLSHITGHHENTGEMERRSTEQTISKHNIEIRSDQCNGLVRILFSFLLLESWTTMEVRDSVQSTPRGQTFSEGFSKLGERETPVSAKPILEVFWRHKVRETLTMCYSGIYWLWLLTFLASSHLFCWRQKKLIPILH